MGLSQETAVEVMGLEKDGPASQSGMSEGDLIISLGEQAITGLDDLQKRLSEIPVGIPAEVVFLRNNRLRSRFIVPGEYPSLDV
jgi:S1-C subfamily serine protease